MSFVRLFVPQQPLQTTAILLGMQDGSTMSLDLSQMHQMEENQEQWETLSGDPIEEVWETGVDAMTGEPQHGIRIVPPHLTYFHVFAL
jgi:hypothetical protein